MTGLPALALPLRRRYLVHTPTATTGHTRFLLTGSGGGASAGGHEDRPVAKTTPAEFIQQVRAETRKVAWPTWRETWVTALMVVIMTSVLAVFFLGVDAVFEAIVRALLKFAQ